jgi:hypothetical protein
MAETRALAYAQQLDALTRQAEALSPEAKQRIAKLLKDANREIIAALAKTPAGTYNSARLKMLKAEIDRAMQDFASQGSSQIAALQAQTYREVALSVDATVAAATGGILVQPVIDRAALQVVQGYTADLITGLSHDASAKINAAIQRGFLGGANLHETVNQIGSALEGGAFSGIFSEVGNRAISIATNEVMRVHSLASVSRIRALSDHVSGLSKRWLHIPVARIPRPSHLIADGQVRKPDEPFLVQGEELMYPRDPSGSADNTIGCHCLVQPYLDEEQLKPTDQERQALKSAGISVITQAA